MGLFDATWERLVAAWALNIAVLGVSATVWRLPYPWRNIVDLGTATGLSYGLASLIVQYLTVLWKRKAPEVDACTAGSSV